MGITEKDILKTVLKVPQLEEQLETITNNNFGESGIENISHFNYNALKPLLIETYDGSNQPTHPHVIYFKEKWNGFNFWMVETPFPYSNDAYENPSIHVSHDGENWSVPNGLTNPLDAPSSEQLSKGDFISDGHIFMRNNTMECWYRYYDRQDNRIDIRRRTSTNGVDWTNVETLFTSNTFDRVISPAIEYVDNKYIMYYVNADGGYKIKYAESEDGKTWVNSRTLNVKNITPWHLDMLIDGDTRYLTILNKPNDGSGYNLYVCRTIDNINFSTPNKILSSLTSNDNFDNKSLYKSSLVKVNDEFYLYYVGQTIESGQTKESNRIGLIKGKSPFTLGQKKNSIFLAPQNSFTNEDSIRKFLSGTITYCNITTLFATNNGFPVSEAGTLITHRLVLTNGYQFQEYRVYGKNESYRRSVLNNGNWSAWVQIDGRILNPIEQQGLTFNIVAPKSSKRLTVPYQGVTLNDLVICNPKTPLSDGIAWNCYCSNTNEITVQVHNYTDVEIRLSNQINFTFAVIKRGNIIS